MTPALLGRGREIEAVVRSLDASRPVLVVGAPGIGKTTLLRAGAAVRGARVWAGGGLSGLRWLEYLALARALRREIVAPDPGTAAREVASRVGSGTLLLDDAQWADDGSLAVLEALAGRVALLAAVRPEEGRHGVAARLERAGFARLELGELEQEAAHTLVRTAAPELSAPDAGRVVAAAGGNPFLLQELARAPAGSPTLRLALVARLDGLSPGARSAAVRLALLGRPAEADLVDGHAQALVARGVAVDGPEGLVLRHALLGEAVLADTGERERRAAHADLARKVRDAGEAARHHQQAGEARLARTRALEAAEAAAPPLERARHLAVAALVSDGADADALRLRAARDLEAAGDFALAAEVAQQVTGTSAAVRGRRELVLARSRFHLGDAGAGLRHVEQGLAVARAEDGELEGRLLLARAEMRVYDFDPGAVDDAQRGWRLVTAGGQEDPSARKVVAQALYVRGEPAAVAQARAAAAEARRAGDHALELEALAIAAGALAMQGQGVAALRAARVAEARADAVGSGRGAAAARYCRAWLELFHRGDCHAALEACDRLLEDPLGLGQEVNRVRMLRALALADLGRDEAARRLADEALTWATTDDGRTMGAYVGAEVDWLGGRARASLRTAREAIALQPEFPLVAALAAVAAWAAVDLGLRFELPALRDGPLHLPGHAAEAAAVAALSREDAPAEAERRFDAAAEAVADGSVRDELRCRWGAGEAALRSGARARARRRLLEVEDRARAHGFVPLLNRIRATQRRAGAKVGAGPRDAAGGLTAREQEVLGLVGEGCASGEIALRLGVATSTVETHVRSAMAKLGARSRAQAAAIARRRGG